jgi:Domain of unknown function (DUF3372)
VHGLAADAYEIERARQRLPAGGDPVVRQSSYQTASGTFTVPARTVAVFVTR